MAHFEQLEQGGRLDITALILCYNEEIHLDRCLSRIAPFVKRVVMIDSYSTDATVEIAKRYGADVLQRKFTSHSEQFNWGMENADIQTAWTLRLDSDEYLDDLTIDELRKRLPQADHEIAAYDIRRTVIFQGGPIRFGGFRSVRLTRVWRTGHAMIEQRWMDEHVLVTGGEVQHLKRGYVYDENLNDITWWTEKHNNYSTRQMIQYMLWELGNDSEKFITSMNKDAKRKRLWRERYYLPMPLYLRSILYFFYRYVFLFGFLDGRRGFLFHFLQGLWNFFLVDAKVEEARAIIEHGGAEAFRAWIKAEYNLNISVSDACE